MFVCTMKQSTTEKTTHSSILTTEYSEVSTRVSQEYLKGNASYAIKFLLEYIDVQKLYITTCTADSF